MRSRLLTVALMSLPLFAACAGGEDDLPSPYDDDFPVSEDNVNAGAPDHDSLPDDNKADAVYPAKFEIGDQSPVVSQGSRGVCSIFASTALIENVYIKAGMPVAEADFSEQYLQWAAKNLQGAFPNTDGSNAEDNIETVVNYGTVKEAEWRYEAQPWTAANDPACGEGENKPTKCYTNGEPPANVAMAQKFKVPSKRWIANGSIKAHIFDKKTGVNVGMTFFYQSWNHRKSTVPVDADLWRKGIVTYPNEADKTASLAQRAGHAIHIIGWDDDMEVPMRDGEGKPVLDAQGTAKMEKGFWLFKNSWGTAAFGVEHPTGAGYGWLSYRYVKEYGRAVAAETPTLGGPVTAEVCDDAGMNDEDGDTKKNCADSDCSMHPSCSSGGTAHNYAATPAAAIPDNAPAGISNTINVTDTGTITDAKLTVDITHSYRGDLKVTLSKGTDSVVVHNGTGGSADDLKTTFPVAGFVGKALAGGWTLKVVDGAAQDVGTLNSWALEVTSR